MTSGVYAIVNKQNGHKYVGSSSHVQKRKQQHFNNLEKQCHPNPYLQCAWNKYGKDNFEFILLLKCEIKDLITNEQIYLDQKPEYNLSFIAGKIEMTPEVRNKISSSNKGKSRNKGVTFTKEHRENISKALVIRMANQAEKDKLAERNRSRVWTDELRERASVSHKGMFPTEEAKKKISEALKGRQFSDASKEKMSNSQKGNTKAQGHKNALGYKHTDETKAHLAKALTGNTNVRGKHWTWKKNAECRD